MNNLKIENGVLNIDTTINRLASFLYEKPNIDIIINVDDYKIEVSIPVFPDSDRELQWSDGALSQGRKISLSGMPLPDVAQHQEGESDYEPEKTHVDAFNLDLSHDVTDIFVPFGTEQMALEVRRSLCQEIWSTNSLPLEKQYDKPFGPCWSSSICPSIHATYYHGDRGYSMSFSVTDHMGQTYSFRSREYGGLIWDGSSCWTNGVQSYEKYKFPGTSQSALSLEDVEFDYSTATGGVLHLPNGTEIEYDSVDMYTLSEVDPTCINGDQQEHIYARVKKVTDRYGNELTYSYDLSSTDPATRMIPTNITSSAGLELTIEHADGLVTNIVDPRGNSIAYGYADYTWVSNN